MRVVEWMGDCTLIIPILPSPFPSPSPISFSILIFLFSHLINTILPSSYPISFSHLILPPLPTHDYYSPIFFFHVILSSNSSLSLSPFPSHYYYSPQAPATQATCLPSVLTRFFHFPFLLLIQFFSF